MSKKYYIPVLVAVVLSAVGLYYFKNSVGSHEVKIDSNRYNVEIADTKEKRELGLMDRKSLSPKTGMLFIFEKEEVQKFWNQNTLIPLDVIWISGGRVVGISRLDDISKGLQIVDSIEPVNYVLELPSGTALEDNIQIGSEVKVGL